MGKLVMELGMRRSSGPDLRTWSLGPEPTRNSRTVGTRIGELEWKYLKKNPSFVGIGTSEI
ncbi:4980_t:CDS:2 [Diversispora eburnea]|uniref:4980_t:CDS:1 n=1 Tax=Diversispora eburnea TaxID=1213867 RepID=A0A9N9G437_9GLOM|nr:4980_t:CDS:2 [Diversispora eburnea]